MTFKPNTGGPTDPAGGSLWGQSHKLVPLWSKQRCSRSHSRRRRSELFLWPPPRVVPTAALKTQHSHTTDKLSTQLTNTFCRGTHRDPSGLLRRRRSEGLVPVGPVLQCRLSRVFHPAWAGPGGRFLRKSHRRRCNKHWTEGGHQEDRFYLHTWGYFHYGLWHLQFDRKVARFSTLHKADDAVAVLDEQEIPDI